jgi:hypothetical protein
MGMDSKKETAAALDAEKQKTNQPQHPPYRQPILLMTTARGRGGAARQGRPPRPFLVLKIITALKEETGKVNRYRFTGRKAVTAF